MPRNSVSTLIYFQERSRKRRLEKKSTHANKGKVVRGLALAVRLIVLLSLAILTTWGYLKYHPLTIEEVVINGGGRFVNMADVRKVTEEKTLGKNILIFNKSELEDIIRGNFLAVKEVSIRRALLHTVKIQIVERVPIALITTKSRSDFFFVDSEGFILGMADKSTTNLPVINYNSNVEVGKFIEAHAIAYYFDLIKALDEDGILVSTMSSYPRYTQFYMIDGAEVLFTNDQNPGPQAKIFAKMMEAFKTEGKKVRKIDLRFDKVIVEFIN